MLNDRGNEGATSNQMAEALTAAQTQQQTQQTQQAKPAQAPSMLSGMGGFMRLPLGLNPASEILTRMQRAIEEKFSKIDANYNLKAIAIDQNNSTEISISVLILALSGNSDKAPVAFHTLILEGSIDPIPTIQETEMGQQITVIRVAGDGNDSRMRQAVQAELTRTYGNRKFINADSCVVPRGFNYEDERVLYTLVANAVFACYTELKTRTENVPDLNLGLIGKDNNLAVQVKYDGQQQTDAVGMPIRSDIELTFSAVSSNRGAPANQSLHAALEESVTLTRATGYVDLIWAEDPGASNAFNQFNMQQGMMRPMNQKYAARLVLTSLVSDRLMTLPAILLALVAALSLRNNNAWFNALRPRNYVGQNTIDIKDIGAIGYEVGVQDATGITYDRINTKTDTFRNEQLGQLISAYFKPGLVVSLDVPECGPSTWCLGAFSAAALTHPEYAATAARANEAIIAAAMTLTNGHFGKYFKGDRVCIDDSNRIHGGYYSDINGVKRDLRDIDHLAILNLTGGKDQNAARDWSDTHQQIDYPQKLRLASRMRMLEALRVDPVVNSFYRRVTFLESFNEALLRGVADCGLTIRPASNQEMMDYERATYNSLSAVMMSNSNSSVFNGSTYSGGAGNAGGFHTRW